MLVFEERGKPEFPEKNLSEQSREPTNSAHIWRRVRESNPGHIGGRRALSPLHQPCSPNTNPELEETKLLTIPYYLCNIDTSKMNILDSVLWSVFQLYAKLVY